MGTTSSAPAMRTSPRSSPTCPACRRSASGLGTSTPSAPPCSRHCFTARPAARRGLADGVELRPRHRLRPLRHRPQAADDGGVVRVSRRHSHLLQRSPSPTRTTSALPSSLRRLPAVNLPVPSAPNHRSHRLPRGPAVAVGCRGADHHAACRPRVPEQARARVHSAELRAASRDHHRPTRQCSCYTSADVAWLSGFRRLQHPAQRCGHFRLERGAASAQPTRQWRRPQSHHGLLCPRRPDHRHGEADSRQLLDHAERSSAHQRRQFPPAEAQPECRFMDRERPHGADPAIPTTTTVQMAALLRQIQPATGLSSPLPASPHKWCRFCLGGRARGREFLGRPVHGGRQHPSRNLPPGPPHVPHPQVPALPVLAGCCVFHQRAVWLGRGRHPRRPAHPCVARPAQTRSPSNPAQFPAVGSTTILLADTAGNGAQASATVAADGTLAINWPSATTLPLSPARPTDNGLLRSAPVSAGKTVTNEVVGSGDSTQPGQSFTLSKSPVTYLASGSTYASTIALTVNGLPWTEVQSFYNQPANAQIYVSRQDANPDDPPGLRRRRQWRASAHWNQQYCRHIPLWWRRFLPARWQAHSHRQELTPACSRW